jgi:hypothetical protein
MPKQWTPEERKAFGEKMKAAKLAKQQEEKTESKVEASVANEDYAALLKKIEELEARQFFQQPAPVQPVRSITKYSLEAADWPDPRERLANESKLSSFAFKENFILKWDVGRVNYEKDGVHYQEPKFRIELWRWKRDPETQELTNKQYRVHKATFFEDPSAAMAVAIEKGIEVDDTLQKAFLDEMRYMRVRDWLFGIFYPTPSAKSEGHREEVIGNRLVPVIEMSSTKPTEISFEPRI